jgi:CHAD domain-containing protein
MNKHQGIKTGDFLYHYFRKKNASFRLNIIKAGITLEEDDIHKSRVDLKKIFALFGFFDMIDTDLFILEEPEEIFRDVFESAGNIREIQMNLLYIDKLGKSDPELDLFVRHLKNNSGKEITRFISSIVKFDEKHLNQIRKSIKKSCREINFEKIIDKSDDFFQLHSAMIRKLKSESVETENIHKIRKEMKKISAVADLLNQLKVDKFMEKLISALNQTELIIGEWHDRIIFYHSLDTYIKENEHKNDRKFTQLEHINKGVYQEAESLLEKLLPALDKVVILIAEIPFLRIAGKT